MFFILRDIHNHILSPSTSQFPLGQFHLFYVLDLQFDFSLFVLKMFRSNCILLFTNLSSDIFFLKYYVSFYFSFSVSWCFLLYDLEVSSQLLLFTDIRLPNPISSWKPTSCPRRNWEESSISGYFIQREPGFEPKIQTRLACTWRIFLYVQILEFSDLLPDLASRFKDVLSKCPSGWRWPWPMVRADSARRVARGLPLTYSHVSKHNSVKLLRYSGNYVYHYFNISKTLRFTQAMRSYASYVSWNKLLFLCRAYSELRNGEAAWILRSWK
jgi:hypothetical protein